ncbi:MAG: phosphotransferase [Asgard group archaeon]|nr:phosphotransferase [Asgard group archaeon]
MPFFEERNPADITIAEIIPPLKNYFPEINKEDIRFFYHGTYNVFLIKDDYILRVPDRFFRNKKGLVMLQKESQLLSFLNGRVPLPIPQYIYLNNSSTIPFSIHKIIPGVSLNRIYMDLTNENKFTIAKTIADFLNVLHSPDMLTSYSKEFHIDYNKEEFLANLHNKWSNRYSRIKEVVFPYINVKHRKWLIEIFDEYLNNDDNFKFNPSLVHMDFDTSNILINPINFQITGIIDFEDSQIYDPAYDLQFINQGVAFSNVLLQNYSWATKSELYSRIKFYYYRQGVEYLEFGIDNNRPLMIDEGKKMLKASYNKL